MAKLFKAVKKMALDDKLAYLIETKNQLKTVINNNGGNLTDKDAFRSYVTVFNEQIEMLNTNIGTLTSEKTQLETDKVQLNEQISELQTQLANSSDIFNSLGYLENLTDTNVFYFSTNPNYMTSYITKLGGTFRGTGNILVFAIENLSTDYTDDAERPKFTDFSDNSGIQVNFTHQIKNSRTTINIYGLTPLRTTVYSLNFDIAGASSYITRALLVMTDKNGSFKN